MKFYKLKQVLYKPHLLRWGLLFYISLLIFGIDGASGIGVENEHAIVIIEGEDGSVLGSGFLISPEGLILTNYTIVKGHTRTVVTLYNKKKLAGDIFRVNRKRNIALVKVKGADLPFLKLGDSGTVRIIDKAIALGYPTNETGHFIEGRVVNIEKAEKLEWLKHSEEEPSPFDFTIMIKTDIVKFNLFKGSALLNIKDEVIAINTFVPKNGGNTIYSIAINEAFEAFSEELGKQEERGIEIKKGKFEYKIRGNHFAMYVPSNYNPLQKWPLILAFHPAGDGGEIRDFWETDAEKNGFIAVCGYTFQGDIWCTYDDYRIFEMLKYISKIYNIDKKRIYLTGLSGGAVFTYYLGINYPGIFAAMAPVSGCMFNVDNELVYSRDANKHIPIFIVQGSNDTVVPVSIVNKAVDKLRSFGYKVSYSEIKGMGHEHIPYKDKIYKEIISFFNNSTL